MSANNKNYTFLGLNIGRIGWWGSLVAFLTIPVVTLPYLAWFFVVNGRPLSDDPGQWAQFGDYIAGTAGPIIGFASIMVLIATLHSQQTELSEQRRQVSRQAFEQTFFTWLNSYRTAVNQFQYMPIRGAVGSLKHGVDGIHWMLSYTRPDQHMSFDEIFGKLDIEARNKQRQSEREGTLAWWLKIFDLAEPQLGSLIRTLYTLVRWVDQDPVLSTQEKWDYIAIMRAQLSSPELRILFFNGYTTAGTHFTKYIDRYALLDNLPLHEHAEIKWGISAHTHPFHESAFNSKTARDACGLNPKVQ